MNCTSEPNSNPTICPGPTDHHGSNDMTFEKVPLSNDYKPNSNDVIVGRGKKCYNHFGNQELRRIVKSKLDDYSSSACKHDKSRILSSIVAEIRIKGGFIKKDPATGRWYDVGDTLAREKISQTFRDALHQNYRSSVAFKRKVRQERRSKAALTAGKANKYSQVENLLNQYEEKLYQPLDWRQDSSSSFFESCGIIESLLSSFSNQSSHDNDTFERISDTASSSSDEGGCTLHACSSSFPNLITECNDPFEPVSVPQLSVAEGSHFEPGQTSLCGDDSNNTDLCLIQFHCCTPVSHSNEEDMSRVYNVIYDV